MISCRLRIGSLFVRAAQRSAVMLAPYNIRANMITPGYLPTKVSADIIGDREGEILDHIPLRRAGEPEDWGNAAVFLLSDQLSAYTTGSELLIDGGFHMRPPYPLLSRRDSGDECLTRSTNTATPPLLP